MTVQKRTKRVHTFQSLPEGCQIGSMVLYYTKGWKVGYVSEVKGNTVGIRPIGGYKCTQQKHLVWIPITDIKTTE